MKQKEQNNIGAYIYEKTFGLFCLYKHISAL